VVANWSGFLLEE